LMAITQTFHFLLSFYYYEIVLFPIAYDGKSN